MIDKAEIVLQNIQTRRTIPFARVQTDALSEEHLTQILEAANWAPSHRHTEPWRFVLFQGEGRKRLANLLAETYTKTAGDAVMQRKIDKAHNRCGHVPVIVTIIMKRSPNPEFEDVLAVGAAVQNLQLAAAALGVGVSWSTPGYLDHPDVRAFFKLEDGDRCFGFLYMGYRACDVPNSKRGALEDKITRIDQ